MKTYIKIQFYLLCLLLLVVSIPTASLAACSPPAKIVGGDGYNPTSIQDAYDYANLTLGLSEFTLQLSGEIFSEDLFLDQGTVTLDGGYDCSFTSKTGAPTGIYGTLTVSSGAANFASDIAIVSTDTCDFDRDLDGFTSLGSCLGSADDCNDLDPAISPGASELCDGIDNNCDGQIDEGFAPVDADGDGYFGFDACGVVADDCNDADATIHPDALDTPYDGIDQDCNGVDLTFDNERCLFCHTDQPPSAWPGLHDLTSVPDASCAGCHAPIVTSLVPGHYGRTVLTDGNAMTAGMVIGCESCHDPNSGFHNWGTGTVWPKVLAVTPNISCDTCHESRAAGHVSATAHDNRLSDPVCGPCHTSASVAEVDTLHRSDCLLCHNYTGTAVNPQTVREVILQGVTGTPVGCNDCHNKGDDHLNHDHSATISISADCLSCHDNPQIVAGTHNNGCALCHSSTRPEVEAAIDSGQAECIDCHNAHDHSTVTGTAECAGCHFSGDPLAVDIVPIHNSSCALCHNSTRQEVIDTIASGQGECIDCHSPHGDLAVAHNNLSAPNSCAVCHTDKVTGTDFAYIINYHANPNLGYTEIEKCLRCHDSTIPEVVSTIAAGKGTDGVPVSCANCHVSQHVPIIMPSAIHNFILTNYGSNCYNCHIENYWTHTDMVATNGCGNCHASANQDEYNALHQDDCLVCHLSERAEVISTIYAGIAGTPVECVDCHQAQHENLSCTHCHGYPPTSAVADSHARHDQIGYTCDQCHYSTTTDGTTITNPSNHLNDSYDVAPGVDFEANNTTLPLNFDYSYDPGGGTCSNISCHQYWGYSDPIKWGNINLSASPQITHGDESFEINFNVVVTSCGTNYTCVEPYSCEFQWGDGSSETGACNTSHIYPLAGDYTVTWSVRDANNMTLFGTYKSNPVSVHEIIPAPTIGPILVAYDPVSDIVTLTPPAQTSNGDPITRVYAYWDDGSSDDNFGNGEPLSHQYTATGTYQISMTLYDSNHTQFDVTVAEEPALEISVDSL